MKEDLTTRIRKWYESYKEAPPWSAVAGLVVRERNKAYQEGAKNQAKLDAEEIQRARKEVELGKMSKEERDYYEDL